MTELYLGAHEDDDDEITVLLSLIGGPVERLTTEWEDQGFDRSDIRSRSEVLMNEALRHMAPSVLGKTLMTLAWSHGEVFGRLITSLAVQMANDDHGQARSQYAELLETHTAELDMLLTDDMNHNKSQFLETLLVHLSDLDHNQVNPLAGLELDVRSDMLQPVRRCHFSSEQIRDLEAEASVRERKPAILALVSAFTADEMLWSVDWPLRRSCSQRVLYLSKTAQSRKRR